VALQQSLEDLSQHVNRVRDIIQMQRAYVTPTQLSGHGAQAEGRRETR
jgi:hypothetical protein